MPDVSVEALKDTDEKLSGAGATFREMVSVHEEYEGQTVWEGDIAVFDLKGHPSASIAYAWSRSRARVGPSLFLCRAA